MRTLLLTPRLTEPGGVANYYSEVRKYLPDDVEYFYIGNDSDGNAFIKLLRLFFDYLRFIFVLLFRRPKVVHLNPSLGVRSVPRDALFSFLAQLFFIRRVIFFRGWDLSVEKLIDSNKFLRKLFSLMFFRSDVIIVLASSFEDKLIKWGYKGKVIIETTTVADEYANYLVSESDDRYYNLLFLSRIERDKGVLNVVDAFNMLADKAPKVKLTIAGDGKDMGVVKEYIKNNNIKNVDLLGYVRGDDKINAYSNNGIYIFPTTYGEGLPNSLLEAMAFGMAVITCPVGGIQDLFENNKMGILIENPDSVILKDAVLKLVGKPDLIKRIGGYNRTFVKERCIASKVSERLVSIYESLYMKC